MDRLLRTVFERLIRVGNLRVTTAGGSTFTFGDGTGTPAAIRFTTRAAERGILIDPALRFGEAYMDGGIVVEQGSIADVLAIVLGQRHDGELPAWTRLRWLFRYLNRRLRQFNPRSRARRNVAHHYDLDEQLYATLSRRRPAVQLRLFRERRAVARRRSTRQETPSRGEASDRARSARARYRLRLGRACALSRRALRRARHRHHAVGASSLRSHARAPPRRD